MYTVSPVGDLMGAAGGHRGRQCDRGAGAVTDQVQKKPDELLHHAAGNSR